MENSQDFPTVATESNCQEFHIKYKGSTMIVNSIMVLYHSHPLTPINTTRRINTLQQVTLRYLYVSRRAVSV
jgi:hypothetical protein